MTEPSLPVDAPTVLLAGPPTGRRRSLCAGVHDPEGETDLVFVTYTQSPANCLARVDGDRVGDVVVVTVGDRAPRGEDRAQMRHVDAPADLTRLGIELGDLLDTRERVTVCFDSVTTTLQYAAFEEVYEFLHAVTRRFRPAGAHLHAQVNPLAHDEQVLAGLTTLFDARVDLEPDGLSVRTRPPVVAETEG